MKKRIVIAGIFIFAVILYCFYELYSSKYFLTCTQYSISSSRIEEGIRIVQITDLHNSEFGPENEKLVDQVTVQEPDLIFITGDLVNSDEEGTDIATDLISALVDVAPVYVSLGNHEIAYQENFKVDIIGLYEEAGATVLERQYQDIVVQGQTIRLGGIYGYCLPEKYLKTKEANIEECDFLNKFQDTDLYTILLCHMPYSWVESDALEEWNMDCIFCGHVHGGQVRLPLIGGLWAPDQGWFPGVEAGLYDSEDQNRVMVLSRGLGSTEIIPRFHNIPEIVVVDLVPET